MLPTETPLGQQIWVVSKRTSCFQQDTISAWESPIAGSAHFDHIGNMHPHSARCILMLAAQNPLSQISWSVPGEFREPSDQIQGNRLGVSFVEGTLLGVILRETKRNTAILILIADTNIERIALVQPNRRARTSWSCDNSGSLNCIVGGSHPPYHTKMGHSHYLAITGRAGKTTFSTSMLD